jgi:alpha-L-arabinofuranosidase
MVFAGKPGQENSSENGQTVVAVASEYKISKAFEYDVPATSLTVIRIKRK